MEQEAPVPRTITVADAIELIEKTVRPITMVQFRPVLGHFELIEAEAPEPIRLHTQQAHGHHGQITAVRTEFRTPIPIKAHPNATEEQEPMHGSLAFAVAIAYKFSDEEHDELRRTVFAKVNAILHAWPYWRVFVYSMMSQMGVQPAITPLLQIPEAAKMAGYAADPD